MWANISRIYILYLLTFVPKPHVFRDVKPVYPIRAHM